MRRGSPWTSILPLAVASVSWLAPAGAAGDDRPADADDPAHADDLAHADDAAHADDLAPDPGLLDVSGTWRFRPGDDLRWAAADHPDAQWERRRIPVTTHSPASGSVMGWYRRTVRVPPRLRREDLRIAVGSLRMCSFEVYAGGRRVGGKGSLAPLRLLAPGYVELPVPRSALDDAGRLTLAIRAHWVPAFAIPETPRFRDGLDLPVMLGTRAAVERYVRSVPIPDATERALAVGLTLLIAGAGAYQLVVFRGSRRSEHGWLAAFAFAEASAFYFFSIWHGELFSDALLARRILVVSHFAMGVMVLPFSYALIGRSLTLQARILIALIVACTVAVLSVGLEGMSFWRSTGFVLVLSAVAYAALAVVRAAIRGSAEARIVVVGLLAFLAVGTYEVIWTLLRLPDRTILHIALLVLFASMMWAVAARHTRTAQELEELRRRLENRVLERTRDLEHANAQLVASEERARRANQAKTEFLANMSHEIRTPMNGVLGMADVLRQSELTPAQRAHVETIRSSGRALLTILNDVLDLSKIEAGKLELESVPFSPGDCVCEVAELFRHAAAEQGVELEAQAPADVPRVNGAASRVRQVMLNLVGNAVKFTHRGRIVVSLRWREIDDDRVELRYEVRDTGIGIAEEDYSKLFQPFSQLASSSGRQHGGTGLGLVISKWLVERMGGRIDVESSVGRGTVFRFFVRMRRAAHADTSSASGPLGALPPKLHVLLVEDSVVNQQVATLFLESLGQRVVLASDGQRAIDEASAHPFDVILMDVQMPGMDGIEATQRIRVQTQDGPRPYIVALTASAMDEDRRRCLDAGMDDFLSKPLTLVDLAAALRRAVTSRRAAV